MTSNPKNPPFLRCSSTPVTPRKSHNKDFKKGVLFVGLMCEDIILSVPYFPKEDDKMRSHMSRAKCRGGNGSTCAIIASLLSKKNSNGCVYFFGPMPHKANCSFLIKQFIKYNIPYDQLVYNPDPETVPTKSYIIKNESNGSRTIINYSNRLPIDCIGFLNYFTNIKSSIKCLHWELRWIDQTEPIFKIIHNECNKLNIKISLEIEQERAVAPEYKKDRKNVNQFLKYGDILFFSKDLIKNRGFNNVEKWMSHLFELYKTYPKFHKNNETWVIIPWGEKGAYGYIINHTKDMKFNPKKLLHSPANKSFGTKAIDSIGAGDTFMGSFMYAMNILNYEIKECLNFSNMIAGYKVMNHGFDCIQELVEKEYF